MGGWLPCCVSLVSREFFRSKDLSGIFGSWDEVYARVKGYYFLKQLELSSKLQECFSLEFFDVDKLRSFFDICMIGVMMLSCTRFKLKECLNVEIIKRRDTPGSANGRSHKNKARSSPRSKTVWYKQRTGNQRRGKSKTANIVLYILGSLW